MTNACPIVSDAGGCRRRLNQAFTAAAALPENAQEYRSEIAKSAADVSLPAAIEMLRGLSEPAAATGKIVGLLAAK